MSAQQQLKAMAFTDSVNHVGNKIEECCLAYRVNLQKYKSLRDWNTTQYIQNLLYSV